MFAKRGVKKFLGKACRGRSLVAEIRDKIFEDVTGTQTLLFAVVRVVSRHRVAQSQPLGCSTMASLPKQIFYRRALGDGSSINPKRERETGCWRNRCEKKASNKARIPFSCLPIPVSSTNLPLLCLPTPFDSAL